MAMTLVLQPRLVIREIRVIRADEYGCDPRTHEQQSRRPMTAAIFNLNHPAHTVHWHFFTMSVSNIIVIVLMLIVFVLAIALPFPGHRSGGSSS
jgi:hypothetical protein